MRDISWWGSSCRLTQKDDQEDQDDIWQCKSLKSIVWSTPRSILPHYKTVTHGTVRASIYATILKCKFGLIFSKVKLLQVVIAVYVNPFSSIILYGVRPECNSAHNTSGSDSRNLSLKHCLHPSYPERIHAGSTVSVVNIYGHYSPSCNLIIC